VAHRRHDAVVALALVPEHHGPGAQRRDKLTGIGLRLG
jgi:hypothetical protein